MLLGPRPDGLKIATRVLGVEVWVRAGLLLVPPDLAEDGNVDGAHELLPEDVEAVGCCLVLG